MSFSAEVKKEALCAKITKPCCQKSFFLALLAFGGRILKKDGEWALSIFCDSEELAKIISHSAQKLFDAKVRICEIKKSKGIFFEAGIFSEAEIMKVLRPLMLAENSVSELINFHADERLVQKSCCRKAFIKGAFLMCGTVIDPEKRYHLEFVTPHCVLSEDFFGILRKENLKAKRIVRKSNYVLYFKQGDDIADILGICGSVKRLMDFHNIRILKDMRNNVNRIVNCESANMDKTIDAAFKQTECIEFLKKSGALDSLSPALKEIATLRLENAELSLSELGKLVTPNLTRSGVNHRLKKLCSLAEKLKSEKDG